jgi:hypothetical protein
MVMAAGHRWRFWLGEPFSRQIRLAGFDRCLRVESRHPSLDHELQKKLGLGVEHAGHRLIKIGVIMSLIGLSHQ